MTVCAAVRITRASFFKKTKQKIKPVSPIVYQLSHSSRRFQSISKLSDLFPLTAADPKKTGLLVCFWPRA